MDEATTESWQAIVAWLQGFLEAAPFPDGSSTVVLGVLVLCFFVLWRRARGRVRRANRGRQRQAQRAETAAEVFLQQQGYEILDRQLTQRWHLEIDGHPQTVSCRADLLLRRKRRLYVADVKTGGKAPDPKSPATRRQLLEYFLVFAVDGVLIVDMEQRQIRTVGFPDLLIP